MSGVFPNEELAGPIADDEGRQHRQHHVGAHTGLEPEGDLNIANRLARRPFDPAAAAAPPAYGKKTINKDREFAPCVWLCVKSAPSVQQSV